MKTHLLIQCLLLIGGITVNAQTWLTNGLVGYFPFNGNANDESGFGHNATVMGDGVQLVQGVNGAPNSAYRGIYPGGLNYIEGSGIDLANSPLSISLWFKKDYTDYSLQHGAILRVGVVGPAGGETGRQISIAPAYNGAGLRFTFFYDDFNVATPVGNGTWSHIGCTFNNSTMERRIYIDGNLIATNIAVRGFSGPTYFDFTPSGGAESGMMDQVRFYNRVLSAGEIAQLYQVESVPESGVLAFMVAVMVMLALRGRAAY